MDRQSIIALYKEMLNDGFMTLDLKSNWECKPCPISRGTLTCDDGKEQEIWLVWAYWKGKPAYLIWVYLNDKYVENFVCYDVKELKDFVCDDVVERVVAIFQRIVEGGATDVGRENRKARYRECSFACRDRQTL